MDDDAEVPNAALTLAKTALAQLQLITEDAFAGTLVWVTRGGVGVSNEDSCDSGAASPAAAPLYGMARTARSESPTMDLRLVDLDVNAADKGVDMLAHALVLSGEPECAIRAGKLLVPRLERIPSPRPITAPLPTFRHRLDQPSSPCGAVLVTGGLGAVGRQVARWLAAAQGCRDLTLLCRRGVATPGCSDIVQELTDLGATVDERRHRCS